VFLGVGSTRSMSTTQNSQRPVAVISACGFMGLMSKFTLFLSSESVCNSKFYL